MATRPDMRQAFGLKILNSHHKDIRRLKREGYVAEIHGNKFWNSSFLIMDYLKKNPLKKNSTVMEIGCGWGLLGIFCAKQFNNKVIGIDADENVFPYLDLHAELNGVHIEGVKRSFEKLSVNYLKGVDTILGADICFWDEMTEILYNLIKRAKRAGVRQVIVADPCRPPFSDLAEICEEKFHNVELIDAHLSRPVNASGEILVVK
ncbi:MAG: methyltransferase domain-containing protein [Pseudomonadales bacterium]|nr:methyltransferase domain-containing protein [Pseudomonadales bacterium]